MSAYLLSDREYRAIFTQIDLSVCGATDRVPRCLREEIARYEQEHEGRRTRENGFAQHLTARLFALNVLALCGRYGDDNPDADAALPPLFSTADGLHLTPGAWYGLLHCLHYQCSEELALDHPDYALLGKLLDEAAHACARQAPGYHWGLAEPIREESRVYSLAAMAKGL